MLAASYFFYGYWNWRFVFLLAASTVGQPALRHAILRSEVERTRKALLAGAVAVNLASARLLQVRRLLHPVLERRPRLGSASSVGNTIIAVTLPVGISFFTFQALSYVIDIYRGTFEPVPLLDFAVYLSFFPHLVAGPIVRAREFMPQLDERKDPRRDRREPRLLPHLHRACSRRS